MTQPLVRRARPERAAGSSSADGIDVDAPHTSRLDAIAAAQTPPAHVERARGDEIAPPLLRALVDLTRRNMAEFVGGAWDEAEKRDELGHAETRHIAVRAGRQLLGFAAWRLTEEEGVLVGYLYELQLETFARGMRLGTELMREAEAAARAAGAHGLMLTVHTRNSAARRFYMDERVGFELSPLSPAMCAPPCVAAGCHYEILQRIWHDEPRRLLRKKGAVARRTNYVEAIEDGRLKIRVVMKGGRRAREAADDELADPMTGPRT